MSEEESVRADSDGLQLEEAVREQRRRDPAQLREPEVDLLEANRVRGFDPRQQLLDLLGLEVVGQLDGDEAGETLHKQRVGDLLELGPPVHEAAEPDVLEVAELLVGAAEVIEQVPQQLHGDLGAVEVHGFELHQAVGHQGAGVGVEAQAAQVQFLQGERFGGLDKTCCMFAMFDDMLTRSPTWMLSKRHLKQLQKKRHEQTGRLTLT